MSGGLGVKVDVAIANDRNRMLASTVGSKHKVWKLGRFEQCMHHSQLNFISHTLYGFVLVAMNSLFNLYKW